MIQKHFEQFGELSDCVLMQDKTTGRLFIFWEQKLFSGKSRGFGFITYKDSKKIDFVLTQTHMIETKTVKNWNRIWIISNRWIVRGQFQEINKEKHIKMKVHQWRQKNYLLVDCHKVSKIWLHF